MKTRQIPSLPWRQLVILAICRLADPIALSSVFPYLPEMIESFNVPKSEVSKWAGITSAAFSLSQACTGVLWGRASDKFGRKPVILCGMMGIMSSSLLFGFSTSLGWAIFARCLSGASNGNVGLMRTAVAELVPQKELQPQAFSIMPLVWTIGSTLGPGFGGALANPARKYPKLFDVGFFRRFPFALPNIASATIFLIGLAVGILFLVETLHAKKDRRDYGLMLGRCIFNSCSRRRKNLASKEAEHTHWSSKQSRYTSLPSSTHNGHPRISTHRASRSSPKYSEVFSHQSNMNLLVYTLLALHSIAYDQLLPIFMHYPRQNVQPEGADHGLPLQFSGGFGINSDRIGALFMAYGLAGMIIQFAAFPYLARRWGALKCLKLVSVMFPVVYMITPFTALFPTSGKQQLGIMFAMLFKCWASVFAFPCTTILLTNSATSLRILGTLNGVAVSISALGRAIGPAMGGWTFTLGIKVGYGILPWWVLAAFAVAAAVPVWWLKEMEGFSGTDMEDDEQPVNARHKVFKSEDEDEDGDDADTDADYAAEDDTLLSSHRLSKNMSRERSDRLRLQRMGSPTGLLEAQR